MPRGRSRSPRRRERRSRSRSRGRREHRRDHHRDRERIRSRSRSPYRRPKSRSRSPRNRRSASNDVIILPTPTSSKHNDPKKLSDVPQVSDSDLEGKSSEEIEMMKLMGFGNFESTKGKHVSGTDVSAVHVIQKRKYRQYMNRRGGFNRPLDFVA